MSYCISRQELVTTASCPLSHCIQVKRGQGVLCILCPVCLSGLSQGRQGVIPLVCLSFTPPMLPNVLTCSQSSVTKMEESLYLDTPGSLLPSGTAAWRLGSSVSTPELCLVLPSSCQQKLSWLHLRSLVCDHCLCTALECCAASHAGTRAVHLSD